MNLDEGDNTIIGGIRDYKMHEMYEDDCMDGGTGAGTDTMFCGSGADIMAEVFVYEIFNGIISMM